MVRASPSSYSSSSSFISTLGLSRGIMMVPLDFLLPRRGLVCSVGSFFISVSLMEELDEEVDMLSG